MPKHKQIVNLALPSLFAFMAEPLMGILDTIMLGQFSTIALAAAAGVSGILSMFVWLLNFLSVGTTSRIALLRAADKKAEIGTYIGTFLLIAALLGVAAALIMFLSSEAIISAYGFSPATVATAETYLLLRLPGLPFILLYYTMVGFFRGLQDMRLPLRAALVANFCNAGFDYLLIFGAPGLIPAMGASGAAMASVFAQLIALIYLITVFRRRNVAQNYPLTINFSRKFILPALKISQNLFLRTFFLLSGFLIAGSIAARLGEVAQAAHEIGMKLWLLGSFTADAFAVAGQTLIASLRGAKQLVEKQQPLFNKMSIWGFLIGIFFAATYGFLFAEIVSLFTGDRAVIQQLDLIFPMLVFFQPVSSITFILDGLLIGLEATRYLRNAMLIAGLLFVTVSTVSQFAGLGIVGIWLGLSALMMWRFASNLWPFLPAGKNTRLI
jgi:MATE family multidrug resistance protein